MAELKNRFLAKMNPNIKERLNIANALIGGTVDYGIDFLATETDNTNREQSFLSKYIRG